MNAESFPCELVTWEEAAGMARKLAYIVRESGYSPDIVIAIGRGGYVPARVVCDFLLHEKLTSIRIEHWGIAASKMEKATVTFPLTIDVGGQDLLVIDDVTDTGETLMTAVDYLRSLNPKEIRTGVLQHKTISVFEPDYYAEAEDEWRWIIYPWALHEDLVGFAWKVLSDEFENLEGIGSSLSKLYGIVVGDERLELALAELLSSGKAEKSGSLFRRRRGS